MATNGRSSKVKGYRGETEFVEAAKEHGFTVQRNGSVYGQKDRGDIGGMPQWVIQVKNVAVAHIPEYLRDAAEQAGNAGKPFSCVALKLRGKHMRDGAIVMTVGQWFGMVKELEELRAETKAFAKLLRPEG